MINCHGRTSTKDPMGACWPSCIPHTLHLHGWKHSAISVQQEGSSSVQPWSYRKKEEVWALFRGSCGESCAQRHPSRLGKETSLIYLLHVIRKMPAEVSSLLWKEIWKMQPLFLQNEICALITILCTEAHMPVQSKDPYVCAPLPAQLLISWVSGGDFPTPICMLHDFFHLDKEDDDSSSNASNGLISNVYSFLPREQNSVQPFQEAAELLSQKTIHTLKILAAVPHWTKVLWTVPWGAGPQAPTLVGVSHWHCCLGSSPRHRDKRAMCRSHHDSKGTVVLWFVSKYVYILSDHYRLCLLWVTACLSLDKTGILVEQKAKIEQNNLVKSTFWWQFGDRTGCWQETQSLPVVTLLP